MTQSSPSHKTKKSSTIQRINMSGKDNTKKRVRFGTLRIRHHLYTLGDNPSVTYGPPVTIGWESLTLEDDAITETSTRTEEIYTVDEYEKCRPRRKVTYKRPGYRGPSFIFLMLSQVQREALLNRLGFSQKEVQAAVKDVQRIKLNRSLNQKWYFNLGRTATELPTNFYQFTIRTRQLERQRLRVIRNYQKEKRQQQAPVSA
mmetsp:Transcript_22247/g.61810  ORF Transcript_22247/g.61810 Transcript_22247/m.61810 type:complete len:202 (-) Transcript_22247:163-768(-)